MHATLWLASADPHFSGNITASTPAIFAHSFNLLGVLLANQHLRPRQSRVDGHAVPKLITIFSSPSLPLAITKNRTRIAHSNQILYGTLIRIGDEFSFHFQACLLVSVVSSTLFGESDFSSEEKLRDQRQISHHGTGSSRWPWGRLPLISSLLDGPTISVCIVLAVTKKMCYNAGSLGTLPQFLSVFTVSEASPGASVFGFRATSIVASWAQTIHLSTTTKSLIRTQYRIFRLYHRCRASDKMRAVFFSVIAMAPLVVLTATFTTNVATIVTTAGTTNDTITGNVATNFISSTTFSVTYASPLYDACHVVDHCLALTTIKQQDCDVGDYACQCITYQAIVT